MIDGRAFNIMERIPGHSLMEDMFTDAEAGPRVADQLAQTLADLHAMPSSSVEESLRAAGFPMQQANLSSGLRHIQRYVAESAMAHLAPATEWLTQNQPSERDTLSVCHGDFHPGNVMADAGRITGVLDWPGALLADPEYDVAITLTLIAVAGPALADNVPAEVFEAFANGYLEAYSRRRPVPPARLRYYRAYRAIRAFVRATAARTPGVDPDLLPRDQYPWAEEGAARRLAGVIKDTTGIDVPLPPGVEPA